MKFEFNWPSGFWGNYVKCVDGTPIWATLAEKLKVKLDLWNLSIAIVSLVSTYQVRIMDLASTVFKKSTFQKISHLNASGRIFDLDVKYSR